VLEEDDAQGEVYDQLRRIAGDASLRDLPLQTALTLARDWLGWDYASSAAQ
jgi:hypothetical protein